MLRIKQFCLSILLMLAPVLALACSGIPYALFHYQPWGQGTKYVVEEDYDYGINFKDIEIREVKFSQLRHVPDRIVNEYNDRGKMSNDFVHVAAFSSLIKNDFWQFYWLTDGQHILWVGKIVQNPPGKPPVDAATFRAYGRFAADKDSLYFDGERTDDNHGEKRVDIDSLQQVGGNIKLSDSGDVLKDRRNLYFQGRWLASAQGYSILGVKSWEQRNILFSPTSCDTTSNPGPWDTILRTATQVFVNGVAIDADPNSFHVVRWVAGVQLLYRDKAGVKRYYFGKDCLNTFNVQRDKVTWMTREASRRGDDCRIATIPNVDPEYFHPIHYNWTVAQYKDLLYQVKYVSPVDRVLTITRLPDPQVQLKAGANLVGKQIYFIGDGGVQIIDPIGPLVWFKNPDGSFSDVFAHDDRYLYFFGDTLVDSGQRRNVTRTLDTAHIDKSGYYLVTEEGKYEVINNAFTSR